MTKGKTMRVDPEFYDFIKEFAIKEKLPTMTESTRRIKKIMKENERWFG